MEFWNNVRFYQNCLLDLMGLTCLCQNISDYFTFASYFLTFFPSFFYLSFIISSAVWNRRQSVSTVLPQLVSILCFLQTRYSENMFFENQYFVFFIVQDKIINNWFLSTFIFHKFEEGSVMNVSLASLRQQLLYNIFHTWGLYKPTQLSICSIQQLQHKLFLEQSVPNIEKSMNVYSYFTTGKQTR